MMNKVNKQRTSVTLTESALDFLTKFSLRMTGQENVSLGIELLVRMAESQDSITIKMSGIMDDVTRKDKRGVE